jgi:cell wall-associated NlpC family hydrolase
LDCSAFVNTVISEVLRKLGIQAESPRHVKEFFRWPMTTASQPNDLSVGALIFVYASQKRTPPDHIGIYVGKNQVIHSPGTTTGRVKNISFDNFISGTIPMDGYGLFAAKKLIVS